MIRWKKAESLIVSMIVLFGVCCLKAHASSVKDLTWITFLEPVNKAPKNDPFEYKDTKGLSGEIAYLYGGIVVRTIKNGVQTNIVSLPIKGGGTLFDIQLSPNGRYVLFKAGNYGDYYDTYRLFYWDLKTKQVFQGPLEELTFYRVNWSPSSRYIAYCLGGNVNGGQYGVGEINRPLRLYTFDTQTQQTHFIAEGIGVTGWKWGGGDNLYYSQTKFDHQWVEGGKNETEEKPLQLNNIYQSSPNGGEGVLIVEGANPIAVSPDGAKILLTSYFDPNKPENKELKLTPHEITPYPYLCFYDTGLKKLSLAEGLSSYPWDVRFLTDNQLLVLTYNYFDKTGALSVAVYNTVQAKIRDITKVKETDYIDMSHRAFYQPQFSGFALSEDNKTIVFSTWFIQGKTGKNTYPSLCRLNVISLESNSTQLICESSSQISFGWGPIYTEVQSQ